MVLVVSVVGRLSTYLATACVESAAPTVLLVIGVVVIVELLIALLALIVTPDKVHDEVDVPDAKVIYVTGLPALNASKNNELPFVFPACNLLPAPLAKTKDVGDETAPVNPVKLVIFEFAPATTIAVPF